jgi:VCBS repeat-containing protein
MFMSTVVVGEVSSLEGMVRAIEPTTQSVRILEVGDTVFQNELLVTSSPANIMLTLNDGEILTLGRNSELFLDGDVFSEVVSNNEAVANVATLQQFVLEGNFDALEDPAAGVEGSPGSAVEEAVEIKRTAAEGEVTSGFTTFGGGDAGFIIPEEDEVVIETGATTFESSLIIAPDLGDEVLQANPDVNTIIEDNEGVSGNVVQGTGTGLDGSDQLAMDGTYVVSVNGLPVGDAASNAVIIPGLYGSLEISADGTYTYFLDNGNSTVQGLDDSESLSDIFVYTLEDGDNDTSSTTLTITINGQTDAPPTVVVEDVDGSLTVADNSVYEGSSAVITGTFTVSAEAGVAGLTVNGTSIIGASSSTPVLVAGSQGLLTVTGYDLVTGLVSYEFKEDGVANNHSNGDDSVQDVFTITVTDVAGTATSDDLNIQILDTAPAANPDSNSVTEDAINPSVGGNVITGSNGQTVEPLSTDVLAADPTSVSEVDGVPVVSGSPTEVIGLYGTLTLNSDGSYTYELDNSNPAVQALNLNDSISESFNYVLADNDGDSSSAELTITINGSEDGLPVVIDCDESVVEGLGNTVTGVFGVQAQAGVDSITVGGENIMNATASAPVVIQGSEGDLTITGYNPLTGEVSYSYTIDTDTSDHSAGDDSVKDTFEVVVTDLAGQTVVDYHDIQVLDTEPTAVNDINNITEDDYSVSGNVIGGNSSQGVDIIGTDPTTVTSVSGSPVTASPAVIVGTYGTLTLSEDGGYVYLLDNTNMAVQALSASSQPLKETVSYTLTDNDGDTSSAILEIIINGQDDAPPVIEIQDADLNVSPADNSVVEGSSDTVTGVINVSADVGIVSIEIQGVEVSGATPTTPIIIPGAQGTLTIVGYDPISGDVAYEYTEDGLANTHSATDDNVVDNFFVEVTDASGESSTDNLDIQILDTAPIAQADNNSITEDDNIVEGNVIANTDNDATQSDILGADATVVTSIDGVSVSSGTATVSGTYGTLTINADGSYSYELNNNHPDIQGLDDGEFKEDTFEYVITDADGDSSTTTLTISINGQDDGAPVIDVDDNNGADAGDHSVIEGSTTPITGTITISAEAGIDTVEIGGEVLNLTDLANGTASDPIDTGEGTLTITGYNPLNGELTYTYTVDPEAVDHTNGAPLIDSIDITVTDITGEETSTDLEIAILDTAPNADDDSNNVTEDIDTVATGTVISNDSAIDQPIVVTPATLTGTYGTLELNADGSYSYTLDNSNSDVQSLDASSTPLNDSFTYTLTDSDGSTDTAVLSISINGQDDGAPVIIVEDTDGNASAADNSVEEGSTTPITGTITISAEAGIDTVEIGGEVLNLTDLANGTASDPIDTGEGTLTITGYNPLNGELTYTYTVDPEAVDHTNGAPLIDSIDITVTDITGEETSTDLEIAILDTAPNAVDDIDSITEDSVSVDGNVMTMGAGADILGVDATSITDVDGSPVTAGPSTVIVGTYGTLELNADGTYVYFLDNTNSTVQNLSASSIPLNESFSYTLTDADGDSDVATLTITINGQDDAVPVIDIVDEDGNNSPGHNSVEECSGNTVDGTINVSSEVGIATVTIGGINIANATPNAPVTISGAQGVLTVTSYDSVTGEITYIFTEDDIANDHSAGDFSVLDQFDVVVTDILGQATTESLDIQILDTAPVAVPDENTIVEPRFEIPNFNVTGFYIPDQYTSEGSTTPYHSSFTIDPYGLSSYRVTMGGKNIEGASVNAPVIVDLQYATIEVTGFNMQTGVVEYTYTGDGRAVDHSGIDRASDRFELLISAPVDQAIAGNVLLGTGANFDGKDIYCDDSLVTAIDGGTLGASLQGNYGSVTLNPDGTYEYVLDANHPAVIGLDLGDKLTDTFTYTITDADGDTNSTTLTITVDGYTEVVPTVNVADMDGNVTTSDNNVMEGTGNTVTGTISFTIEEDIYSILIGGQDVYRNGFQAAEVLGNEGRLTITGIDLNLGIITYKYKEDNTAADHRDGDDSFIESFSVVVTDVTGATATDSLDIQIMDSAPIANPDVNTIDADDVDSAYGTDFHGYGYNASNPSSFGSQTTSDEHDDLHEQGAPVVEGNVMTGTTLGYGSGPGADTLGADTTKVTEVNGVTIGLDAASQFRGIEIVGQYGTLMMKSGGQYEYVLDTSNAAVIALDDNQSLEESFEYTITDQEGIIVGWVPGDSDTSTLTITINGSDLDGSTGFGSPLIVGGGHCMDMTYSALMVDEETMYMAEPEQNSHETEMLDLSELISDSDVSEESLNDYLAFIEEDSDEDSHDDDSEINDDHSSSDDEGSQVTKLEMETAMVLDTPFDEQDEYSNGDYLNE